MPAQSPFNTAKTRVGISFRRFSSLLLGLFSLCTLLTLIIPLTARAETDTDREFLELYYEPQDLDVSAATRSPRPLSRSAENITVITAKQIEAMNAHTLADVLNTVPGVQVNPYGGPGSAAIFGLEGALNRHALVLIDNVPVDDILANFSLIGQIPVQNIERVEVIKSPSSAAWGSALGGVISVITKNPADTQLPSGSASFSGGENGTRDTRGELTGSVGRLGYYLSGATLHSNGFSPNNATENNNLYAKLRWEIPGKGNIRFTLNDRQSTLGSHEWLSYDAADNHKIRYLHSTLGSDYALTDRLDLSLLFKATRYDYNYRSTSLGLSPGFNRGDQWFNLSTDEETIGGMMQLTWRQGLHTITGGLDYDHGETDTKFGSTDYIVASNDRWGLFLNDTLAWERFTLTPAIRYDLTSHTGDFFSSSLGLTINITDKTLIRGFVAQGYSQPTFDQARAREKGRSIQLGIESSEIPYLWLKGTWFRNSTWDIPVDIGGGNYVLHKALREGFELEARTMPVFSTWLTAGYVFVDAEDRTTEEEIPNEATQTWDLGLHYDDQTLRGSLVGHYIWWNSDKYYNARYDDFLWDINLGWRFLKKRNTEAEFFVTGHNIFNGKQYQWDAFPNPSRWFEGGLRIKW